MAAAPDYSHFVRTDPDGRSRLDLAIDGITCAACLPDIETAMKRLPGVVLARLNLTSHRLALTFDAARVDPARMTNALESIGYRAYPYEQRQVEAEEAARFTLLLKCLGVAFFAAMNIMLLSISVWSGEASSMPPETRDFFHLISALVALPAAAYAGQPFYTSAWTSLRQGRLNMDVPITIGVILALGMSLYETKHHAEHAYFDSAIMLLTFLLAQAERLKPRIAYFDKDRGAEPFIRAIGGRYHQDRPVHLGSTRDHVLDVVGVTRAVDVRVVALVGLVLDVGGRDGDTALTLFRGLVDLVVRDERTGATALIEHLRDGRGQCGLTVVDMTNRSHVHVGL